MFVSMVIIYLIINIVKVIMNGSDDRFFPRKIDNGSNLKPSVLARTLFKARLICFIIIVIIIIVIVVSC